MSAKDFFKGLSWLILLNLLVKPLWIFGIDRAVQNNVGHETYGIYFSILNLSIILSFIADAGLSNMYNRQVAIKQSPDFRKLLALKTSLSVIYFCIYLLVCRFANVRITTLVLFTGLLQMLASWLIFFRSIITGNQLFNADARLSVLDKILMILICGLLLYVPNTVGLTIERFVIIQCACTFIAIVAGFAIAVKTPRTTGPATALKEVFALTYPFILLILLMSVHNRLDAFLLERIHINGAYESGVYAAAYRLLDAGNMVGYLAASFLVPFIARNLVKREMIAHTVKRISLALLALGIGAVVIVFLFATQIVKILYHTDSEYYAAVLVLCIAVLPAYYMIHVYGSLLAAAGLFRKFSLIMLVSVSVNIAGNVFLIREYGAAGCCVAALVSQYMCAGLCYVFSTRALGLNKPGAVSVP